MKRILIVDDEMLVRIGIRSMLEWEENGYTIVGEATDGRDAIEKVEALGPHIILTDIMMDGMNGLELIEWCAKHHPDICTVVLSNYTDFDKVRSAMKLGARDYLFKLSITGDEVLRILNELAFAEDGAARQDLHQLADRSATAIRQRLLQKLLTQTYDDPCQMLQELEAVSGSFRMDRPYGILHLRLAEYKRHLGQQGEEGASSALIDSALKEGFTSRMDAQFFRLEAGSCFVLVNVKGRELDEQTVEELLAHYERFAFHCERVLGLRCDAVLGGPGIGLKPFAALAAQCIEKMEQRFFHRSRGMMLAQESIESAACAMPPGQTMQTWLEMLDTGQFDVVYALMDQLFHHLYGLRNASVQDVRELLHDLYRLLRSQAESKGIVLYEYLDRNGLTLYQAIHQYELLRAIEKSFREVVEHFASSYQAMGGKQLHPEIASAVAYIRLNLKSDLSVPALADRLHMSESSFSRLFKREMGQGYIEYVNGVRIEKASDMLRSTERKVQEIAWEVGIDNPNYFSILFKKATGLSPNEFRNRCMTEK